MIKFLFILKRSSSTLAKFDLTKHKIQSTKADTIPLDHATTYLGQHGISKMIQVDYSSYQLRKHVKNCAQRSYVAIIIRRTVDKMTENVDVNDPGPPAPPTRTG
jgi:hypothetical protein